MTHSHDTSTPAMSAETVPSEEFVLVPREATERMLKAADGWTDLIDAAGGNTPESRRSEFRVAWRAMIAAAPVLTASHLAKEGGEAGAVDWLWWGRDEADKEHVSFGRWQKHPCQHRYKLAAIQPTEHDHPQPSPALAKGGDAVREALKPFAKAGTVYREALAAPISASLSTDADVRAGMGIRIEAAQEAVHDYFAGIGIKEILAAENALATRPAEPAAPVAEVKAWLLGDPATGQWIEVDGHRVEYSRGMGTPAHVLASAFQAERARADAAEQRTADALARAEKAQVALLSVREAMLMARDVLADPSTIGIDDTIWMPEAVSMNETLHDYLERAAEFAARASREAQPATDGDGNG